ncbi:MAG TPA: T9SS type A sorting domain-containing protein [Firmicutes bacterium]|nr:T9SS type A sorting domain-containing protein [Bacillota bacterium]
MKSRIFFIVLIFLFSLNILSYSDNTGVRRVGDLIIEYSGFTFNQIEEMKGRLGVFEPGRNYNLKFNGLGTGFVPPNEGQYLELLSSGKVITSVKSIYRDKAPANYDNSTSKYFPPIGNQAAEGSCTCWTYGYYMKTYQEAREQDWDLSGASWNWNSGLGINEPTPTTYHNKIFTPDFIYHQINKGIDSGSSGLDAIEFLDKFGCATWDKMPYSDSDHTTWPSKDAYRNAAKYKAYKPGTYFVYIDDTGIQSIKTLVSNNVLIGIAVDAGEYNNFDSNDLLTADTYNSSTTNHANTIVGYDDNYGPYSEGGGTKYGAFKVANSWGVGIYTWENVNDGFYWLSYEALKKLSYQWGLFYEDRNNYTPKYLAVVNMNHNSRKDCLFTITKNKTSTQIKFSERYYRGGQQPFPANDILFDITDLCGTYPRDTYTLTVYDLANNEFHTNSFGESGTATIGTVNKFWIEDYSLSGSDYDNGIPGRIYKSEDSPKNTVNSNNVNLRIFLKAKPKNEVITDTEPVKIEVYPNPITFTQDSKITFRKLKPNSVLKLYTLSGQLIFEYINESGISHLDWYLENQTGTKISAGIYIFYYWDEQGNEQTGKIGIKK